MSFAYLPYCYLIGWSKLNVWYYGSEYGTRTKISNPYNLWRTYHTSSTNVSNFVQQHGDPDVIQVRKIFTDAQSAIDWEYKVLRRLRVRHRDLWLNVNDGKAPIGTPWTDARREQHSARMTGSNNPNSGKSTPDHVKHKISQAHLGRHTGARNHMHGRKHSKESRHKMSVNHARLSGPNNPSYGRAWDTYRRQASSASHHPTVFTFTHPTHGVMCATVHEMVTNFPDLKKGGLRALYQGRLLQYKGWTVIETGESV